MQEIAEPGRVVLELKQRPFAPWLMLVVFGLVWLPIVIGTVLGAPMVMVAVLLLILGSFAAIGIQRTARIELTPVRVRIDGYTGTLPRPRHHDLATMRLDLASMSNWNINGRPYWTLQLRDRDGQRVKLAVLDLDQAEAARVQQLIASMQEQALALHGRGEEEIPDELRAVQQRQQAEPEQP